MLRSEAMEQIQIVPAFIPVDMGAAANNGDWVSLKNYARALVVLFKAVGTAGQDPVFTMQQATAVAGTGAKALQVSRIYSKLAVDVTTVGLFTLVEQTAADTYTDATSAEKGGMLVAEVRGEDLDVANDFDCIRLTIPDTGAAAQLGCAFYVLFDPKYTDGPAKSAIAD